MSNYTFYFDESMHDKALGLLEDGSFNFLKDASYDAYVGVFWGVRTKKLLNLTSDIASFESKQKFRLGLTNEQELKTTTFKKKNFHYGLRSFNHDIYCFYDELFDLVHSLNPVIQITIISKMELYIRQVFSNYCVDMSLVIPELFYYSLTKFMLIYGTEQLRKKLLSVNSKDEMNHFVESMISELKTIIDKTQGVDRKRREREAFKQLVFILENSNNAIGVPRQQYPFEYRCSFDGLCHLLEEKRINISTTDVIIDKEKNTYKASTLYDFENTKQLESHHSVELRLSDWIAGFVSRMIVAINTDDSFNEHIESLSELDEKDIVSKHLLSSKWFEIDEVTFGLYRKAFRLFILDRSEEYWATMTAAYFDSTVLFYSLLRYFGSFDDYQTYKNVPVEMHSEYFNACACDELESEFIKKQKRINYGG